MPKLGSKRQTPTVAQRKAAELAAWHDSPEGVARYQEALAKAQRQANELGMDHGLEFRPTFREWAVRLLPAKQYRFGDDHTCAVIHPIDLEKTAKGHGPMATRPPSTVGPDYHGGPFDREKALREHREWEEKNGPLYPAPTAAQREADATYEASLDPALSRAALYLASPPASTAHAEPRVFSASSIALGDDSVPETGGCRRAWAHCYVDKIRKPELQWEQCVAFEAWQESVGGYRAALRAALPEGVVRPVAGQRSASLGTRTHLYAQWYVTGAATTDADVYGPRRLIDWESLPGQVLQSMLPLLPQAGTVAPELAEAEFEIEVAGVRFRGLIDIVADAAVEIWDHKTTRDIRAYALLPDAVADALGAPERSLKNALQSCIYSVYRARKSDPPAEAVNCRWTYGETDRSRRALPVVQSIPYAHALGIVESAADVARTLTYADSSDAPPNTLACDKYGGCWYRGQPCKARRDYGRIALQLEKEDTKMADKKMTFAELQKATVATVAANGKAAPAAAKPATAKNAGGNPGKVATKPAFTPKAPAKKAAPAPEPEETEEEQTEETEEAPAQDGVDFEALSRAVVESRTAYLAAVDALTEALAG